MVFPQSARHALLAWVILGLAAHSAAQESDPVSDPPTIFTSSPNSGPIIRADEREVSGKRLIPNVLENQKTIWLFPVEVGRGRHLKPAVGFALVTAGLVALGPHDTPYFARTDSLTDFNRVFSSRKTSVAMALFPATFYVVALARHDKYAQTTALLAGQAYLDTQTLTLALKSMTRRVRPRDLPADGDFTHTWYKSDGSVISGQHSFPSGHAVLAFSIATVFAQRYRRHRWVPLGGVWVRRGGRLLPCHHAVSFPLGRSRGLNPRLCHGAIRCAPAALVCGYSPLTDVRRGG